MKKLFCLLLIISLTGCGYDEESVHNSTTEFLKRNLNSNLVNEDTIDIISYSEPHEKIESEFGEVYEYGVFIWLNSSMEHWCKCDSWNEIVHITNMLEGRVTGEGTRFEGIYDDVHIDSFNNPDYIYGIEMNIYGDAKINGDLDYELWHTQYFDDFGNPVFDPCIYNQ
jgi:hypothetical protein